MRTTRTYPIRNHNLPPDKEAIEKLRLIVADLPPGYTYETPPEQSIEYCIEKGERDFQSRRIDRNIFHASKPRLDVYPPSFATRAFTERDWRTEAMIAIYRQPPPSPLKQTWRFLVGVKVDSAELIQQQGLVTYRTRLLKRLIHVPPCYENVKRKLNKWVLDAPIEERMMRRLARTVIKNGCKTLNPNLFLEEEFRAMAFKRVPKPSHPSYYTLLSSLPDCLSDLTWVKTLNVSGNKIKKLPPLPPHLTTLEASENRKIDLGVLPESLEVLSVRDTFLGTLPLLPDGLRYLEATRCALKYLPSLPSRLNTLILEDNDLHALPELLPAKLAKLEVRRNKKLTALPELPYSLVYIDFQFCNIKKLPLTFKTDKMWAHLGRRVDLQLDEESDARFMLAARDPAIPKGVSEDVGDSDAPGAQRWAGGFIHIKRTLRQP